MCFIFLSVAIRTVLNSRTRTKLVFFVLRITGKSMGKETNAINIWFDSPKCSEPTADIGFA